MKVIYNKLGMQHTKYVKDCDKNARVPKLILKAHSPSEPTAGKRSTEGGNWAATANNTPLRLNDTLPVSR